MENNGKKLKKMEKNGNWPRRNKWPRVSKRTLTQPPHLCSLTPSPCHLPPSLAPMIGTHGALYRRPQQFGARSAKQYVWSAEKNSACDAKNGACGVKNRRLQHRNMAQAVLELDVIPIMSYILRCAHLRPISLYRCPLFSIYFHFIPLLLSFEKPCY